MSLESASERKAAVLDDRDVKNRFKEYGLTSSQAQIYLLLLTSGPSEASSISRLTRMHRSDVYWMIKELQDLGVVDCIIGFPNRFKAVEPTLALGTLENKLKENVSRLTQKSKMLAEDLETLKASAVKDSSPANYLSAFSAPSSAFSLISGRKRYWQETRSMVRSARREVLRIVDEHGLKTMFATDLFDEFRSVAKRGVIVKLISEVTEENLREARLCAKIFEFRHLRGAALRFIDVDATGVILCGSLDRSMNDLNLDQAKFLKFHDRTFGTTMKFFFDELFNIAKPLDSAASIRRVHASPSSFPRPLPVLTRASTSRKSPRVPSSERGLPSR